MWCAAILQRIDGQERLPAGNPRQQFVGVGEGEQRAAGQRDGRRAPAKLRGYLGEQRAQRHVLAA